MTELFSAVQRLIDARRSTRNVFLFSSSRLNVTRLSRTPSQSGDSSRLGQGIHVVGGYSRVSAIRRRVRLFLGLWRFHRWTLYVREMRPSPALSSICWVYTLGSLVSDVRGLVPVCRDAAVVYWSIQLCRRDKLNRLQNSDRSTADPSVFGM